MISLFLQNVRGLRSELKIRGILGDYDVLVVQETKWDDTLVNRIKASSKGQVFASNGQGRVRGVATLLRGGIFEAVRMDVSGNNTFKVDTSRRALFDFIRGKNMVELWRALNPHKQQFSRVQVLKAQLKQSRIDLCLVAEDVMKGVLGMEYQESCWSDHFSMVLRVGRGGAKRNGGSWCFNNTFLQQPPFVRKM
ncbi:unnamed protein product, partial [Menidia menidia]